MFGTPSGPYGAVPGAPPPPPARNPLIIVLAVLAVIAVGGLGLVVLTRDSGSDDTTTQPPTTEEPPPDDPPDNPPDTEPPTTDGPDGPPEATGGSVFAEYVDEPQDLGDDLVLLEYGVSTVLNEEFDGDTLLPTIGLIIENQGSEMRQSLEISITMYDDDDLVITSVSGFGGPKIHHLPPGETIGLAYMPSRSDAIDRPVARIEVGYGGEGFVYDDREEGSVEVSDVTVEAGDVFVTTRFEVSSTYDYDLNGPAHYVIYRNADGEIVGGDAGYGLGYIPSGSSTRGEVNTALSIMDLDIDLDQVEVHVDAGYRHADG